jgi:hypothetical protein
MIPASLFPLVSALLANLVAQWLKLFIYYYRTGKWDMHWVLMSGGFPSSHSATVTALTLCVGMEEGLNSTIFAVTLIFALIVMYDACHVRYYSGKNIELTQQLIKDLKDMTGLTFSDPIYQEKLKTILGHKVVEVVGGVVVGLIIPLLLSPIFLIS